jgi:hypothetical protein
VEQCCCMQVCAPLQAGAALQDPGSSSAQQAPPRPGLGAAVPGWQLPGSLTLLSVPAAEHSRKPCLSRLMAQWVQPLPLPSPRGPALATPAGSTPAQPATTPVAVGCSVAELSRSKEQSHFVDAGSTPAASPPTQQGNQQSGLVCSPPLRWGLELFAREMQAGFDSAGDEVLCFQDASLFTRSCS